MGSSGSSTIARECGHQHSRRRPRWTSKRTLVDLKDLRLASIVMLSAGVLLPWFGHPGPGCFLRAATEIPCPLCGMSTSVQETMRFDLRSAWLATPAGIAAVVVAAGLLLYRGRGKVSVPAWAPLAVLGVMWIYQLFRFSVL